MNSSHTETRVEVVMPQLGISVTEGTIVQWRKRPGDAVAYEEPICDIDTDKIESELPSPAAGRLVEILVDVGATVSVGSTIAVIASDGSHEAPVAIADVIEPKVTDAAAERRENVHSPVVQRLAAEHGIDLATVTGTGTGGRVRKQDVLSAVADRAGGAQQYMAPAPVPLSRMRRSIGDHMKRSLETAATVTSWIEVDFSAVEAARAELRTTALPVVASATMATLAEFPDLNAWLDGGDIVRHETVNLGIAVALGTEGLLVPVIREAERLSIAELSARIRDLATRARTGELNPEEMRDGTFTITNPGQYGTIMATPVINQPQIAILDIEAIVRRPVVVSGPPGEESIAIRPICVLGLSWDHRALDGVLAAQFLGALRERLERWGA
ncbi:MAG TPA: dihydrolipoamide acetyltransferase family protein [Solirubrobacteraceae bacterium]|nr:dihydrolipoamide acetyltransferase family protein [Solirubrobacteraceae bacterium]